MDSPAKQARLNAGYTIKEAAKKLRYCERTVSKVENHGGASDIYCLRAARLFKCNPDYFFLGPDYWAKLSQHSLAPQQTEAVASASLPLLVRRPARKSVVRRGRRLGPTGRFRSASRRS